MIQNPKLLIVGHARHGKDTAAQMISDLYGLKFTSSSWFCAQEVIWPSWGCAVYPDIESMFQDRVNHRVLWMQMIAAYNTPDKTKTARTMFERGFDMYVGMRRLDELMACRDAGLIHHVVWVDRSWRCPPEIGSTDIERRHADITLDNNGDLADLEEAVLNLGAEILGRR